jgi:flagellar motility protein MotE (MotC chaperone)
MIRYFRELRLIPIAVVASACLLVLTAADLLLSRNTAAVSEREPPGIADVTVIHARPGAARPADPKRSWAQQMFNFPDASGAPPQQTDPSFLPAIPSLTGATSNADITGSVNEPGAEKSEKDEKNEKPKADEGAAAGKETAGKNAPAKEPKDPPPSPNGKVIPLNAVPGPSAAEREILERLQERRQELDKRARELDIREGLIAGAEKRVDSKLNEIKESQAQLAIAEQKKDEAEAARFKGLVTMYENMKPRDAAKIFDHLDIGVLIEVASQINPRTMSEILAQMSADRADQLTVELASRAQASPKNAAAGLPKIEGRPTGP